MTRFASLALLLLPSSACGCHVSLPGVSSAQLDHKAERVERHPLALTAEEILTLDTQYGRVEVVGTTNGTPELAATVRASGRTEEEAQAALGRYELKVERGPDGPKFSLVGEPLSIREEGLRLQLAAHVNFVATVPVGTRVNASSGSGDIVTGGTLGTVNLTTGYGSIRIEEIRGTVHANSGSGKVQAKRLEGDEAVLESGYGSVRVEQADSKRLTCESGSGDIQIGVASSDSMDLSTGYGSVEVDEAGGSVRARSGSGSIRLRGVRGNVDAESHYGPVEVEGVLTSLEASSGSGNVSVRALAGSRCDPKWTLSSSYGRVVLHVPDDFGCQLDASTDYGNVDCDFPVTIEAGKREDKRLKGTVGSGGGRVSLSSGSGSVSLKKL